MNFLITAGATREHLDPVRFLTNLSTGATATRLAESFLKLGHNVGFLHGVSSLNPTSGNTSVFEDFNDLKHKLRVALSSNHYDCVIHCAAVSDYSIGEISASGQTLSQSEKLPSDLELQVTLKPNPKLLNSLREFSLNKKIFVVGFKLTDESCDAALEVEQIFKRGAVDCVIHNLVSHAHNPERRFTIFYDKTTVIKNSTAEISDFIVKLLAQR